MIPMLHCREISMAFPSKSISLYVQILWVLKTVDRFWQNQRPFWQCLKVLLPSPAVLVKWNLHPCQGVASDSWHESFVFLTSEVKPHNGSMAARRKELNWLVKQVALKESVTVGLWREFAGKSLMLFGWFSTSHDVLLQYWVLHPGWYKALLSN